MSEPRTARAAARHTAGHLAETFADAYNRLAVGPVGPPPTWEHLVEVLAEMLAAGHITAGPAARLDPLTCAHAAADTLDRGRRIATEDVATADSAAIVTALAHIAAGWRELGETVARIPAMQPSQED